jgi:hypothetical protein
MGVRTRKQACQGPGFSLGQGASETPSLAKDPMPYVMVVMAGLLVVLVMVLVVL